MRSASFCLALGLLAGCRAFAPGPEIVRGAYPYTKPTRPVIRLPGDTLGAMLVDTGADQSYRVWDPEVADVRDLPFARSHATPLGEIELRVDARTSGLLSDMGYDALLGGDVLRDFIVEVDPRTQQVRFLESAGAADPAEVSIPMRVRENRPFVRLEIGGRTVTAIVDTGAPTIVVVRDRVARKAGLELLPVSSDVSLVDGDLEARWAEARIEIGGMVLDPAPVLVVPSLFGLAGYCDALIGMELLKSFRVRFDYAGRELTLLPVGDPNDVYGFHYPKARSAGLLPFPLEEGILIAHVFPETPAAALGLVRGDIVTRIGDDESTSVEALVSAAVDSTPLVVLRGPEGEREEQHLGVPPDEARRP